MVDGGLLCNYPIHCFDGEGRHRVSVKPGEAVT